MPNQNEQLFRPALRGPVLTESQSKANQWAGRTTLNSGSATVTVSTQLAAADNIILATMESITDQASGFGQGIEVKTISPGNFFTLGTADGVAFARQTTVMWMLFKASE